MPRLSFILCLTPLFLALEPMMAQAQVEREWVDIGTFIEWPETLKGDLQVESFLDEPSVVQTGFSQPGTVEPRGFIQTQTPSDILPTAGTGECLGLECWQVLPEGLLYPSYLAGEKEPRIGAAWLWESNRGLVWEAAVGGRGGLIRKGTCGPDGEGFQLDIEGAALVRIDPEEESDLEAADFRAGFLGTWRHGPWRYKAGYYHISSHLGDEYVIKNPTVNRRNYVRDSLIAGVMYDVREDVQVYGEIAAALNHNGGAELLELQFGAQYAPALGTGLRGAPFAAINGHLRQEFDFGGSVNVLAGWAWRGTTSRHLFRAGFQHYNGPSMQWSLFDRYESLTGLGIWYDF